GEPDTVGAAVEQVPVGRHRGRVDREDRHGTAAPATDPACGFRIGGQVHVVTTAAVQPFGLDRLQGNGRRAVVERVRWGYRVQAEVDRYRVALARPDLVAPVRSHAQREAALVVAGHDRVEFGAADRYAVRGEPG